MVPCQRPCTEISSWKLGESSSSQSKLAEVRRKLNGKMKPHSCLSGKLRQRRNSTAQDSSNFASMGGQYRLKITERALDVSCDQLSYL